MKAERTFFMCPYLDGNPKGVVCNAAKEFIKNIENINLDICMSRHFESCHIYFTNLGEADDTLLVNNNEKGVNVTTAQ